MAKKKSNKNPSKKSGKTPTKAAGRKARTEPKERARSLAGGKAGTDLAARPPWDTPETADQLRDLLEKQFGIQLPTAAPTEGHNSPLDYLAHTFFEGSGSLGALVAGAKAGPRGRAGCGDCMVWANRGGGKTFLGAVATMLDLVFKPGIEIRILGGSMDQSRRMHAHLRRLFEHEELSKRVEGRITDRRLRLVNGSEVELLAQSQTSVRGTRVQKLRCDEVELFDVEVWEAAQLTTRARTVEMSGVGTVGISAWVECLSTMHLPHGLMHRLVEEAREGKRRLFKWGVADVLERCEIGLGCGDGSPGTVQGGAGPEDVGARRVISLPIARPLSPVAPAHGPPPCDDDCPLQAECGGRAKGRDHQPGHIAIWDAIAMKSRVSLATWEAEMLCLRPSRSAAVVPEFDLKVHVVDDLPGRPEALEWFAGMDFGISSPTVILWAGLDRHGVLWVADEYESRGGLMHDHIRTLQNAPWPVLAWIGADPAGNGANSETGRGEIMLLQRAGFSVKFGKSGIFEGLSLLRARLRPAFSVGGGPRLFVLKRCRRLIQSLERYHYDPRCPDRGAPVKDGHDHAVDALRYLLIHLDRGYATAEGRYA